MPQTARQYWKGLRGQTRLNFNWNAIDRDSVVLVTASEYRPDKDLRHSPRFVGDATIRVSEVSPHGPPDDPNHGVTFVVTVNWSTPLNIVTDMIVLDSKPVASAAQPLPWQRLAFTMQRQQQNNWCWAAVATSVSHFYDAGSTWNQCDVANGQLGRDDCCGLGAALSCNVYGFVDDALLRVGHFDRKTNSDETFAAARAEVDAGRPLCLRVAWSGGGAHALAIIGYLADRDDGYLAVDDPIYGKSDVAYASLQSSYQTVGNWTHSYYTKV